MKVGQSPSSKRRVIVKVLEDPTATGVCHAKVPAYSKSAPVLFDMDRMPKSLATQFKAGASFFISADDLAKQGIKV